MSDFTEAVGRLDSLDDSLFLGRICWYAITENSFMMHDAFCQELLSRGFTTTLPPVPRSSDVFKRACTAAQKTRVPLDSNRMNILIREVGHDSLNVWRNVVVEVVDTEGHRLDYIEVAKIHYDRRAEKINTTFVEDQLGRPVLDNPAVNAVIQEVNDLYSAWYNMLTPYAIREHLRKIIRGLGATVLRDGVYFIPQEHAEKVEALEEIVGKVSNGSLFHSLPLLDDRKQRQMLRAAFEADSVDQIDKVLDEVRDIFQKDRKISSDTFANYKVRYDTLRTKIADYSDLLDEAMVASATRLELMDQALFDLMSRVKV